MDSTQIAKKNEKIGAKQNAKINVRIDMPVDWQQRMSDSMLE